MCVVLLRKRGDMKEEGERNGLAALVWPVNKLWFVLETPDAHTAKDQSNQAVLRNVMHNILEIFPVMWTPDNAIVTRWHRDTHVQGVY